MVITEEQIDQYITERYHKLEFFDTDPISYLEGYTDAFHIEIREAIEWVLKQINEK